MIGLKLLFAYPSHEVKKNICEFSHSQSEVDELALRQMPRMVLNVKNGSQLMTKIPKRLQNICHKTFEAVHILKLASPGECSSIETSRGSHTAITSV